MVAKLGDLSLDGGVGESARNCGDRGDNSNWQQHCSSVNCVFVSSLLAVEERELVFMGTFFQVSLPASTPLIRPELSKQRPACRLESLVPAAGGEHVEMQLNTSMAFSRWGKASINHIGPH
jgi:hypothetical protein